jgi:hypothetical protein
MDIDNENIRRQYGLVKSGAVEAASFGAVLLSTMQAVTGGHSYTGLTDYLAQHCPEIPAELAIKYAKLAEKVLTRARATWRQVDPTFYFPDAKLGGYLPVPPHRHQKRVRKGQLRVLDILDGIGMYGIRDLDVVVLEPKPIGGKRVGAGRKRKTVTETAS